MRSAWNSCPCEPTRLKNKHHLANAGRNGEWIFFFLPFGNVRFYLGTEVHSHLHKVIISYCVNSGTYVHMSCIQMNRKIDANQNPCVLQLFLLNRRPLFSQNHITVCILPKTCENLRCVIIIIIIIIIIADIIIITHLPLSQCSFYHFPEHGSFIVWKACIRRYIDNSFRVRGNHK